ncbi:DNA mismatch repair endonuclease MutH [Algicola sagamiensis]|uniref:DNA mismatch repair endonuclease MutH n=1 Tax=Algicola sagamiensis TaxID=163869 RepID=UPI00036E1FDB|nr:DNA mismatch repair endonuclease MutH [Algicola sagamiensis]
MNRPESEETLLERANILAGLKLRELANQYAVAMPDNLKREKGWVGQFIEMVLGAEAGSKPIPDFPHLGIELKTLPISLAGYPLETTFVCTAPLTGITGSTWETSLVKSKLNRVLWIPVVAERSIPLEERIIASPMLWSPNAEEEMILRHDWEELMDMIALGYVEQVSAKYGVALQIRPKAANSKALTEAFNAEGEPFLTLPRGFYLKKQFTGAILQRYFSGG